MSLLVATQGRHLSSDTASGVVCVPLWHGAPHSGGVVCGQVQVRVQVIRMPSIALRGLGSVAICDTVPGRNADVTPVTQVRACGACCYLW